LKKEYKIDPKSELSNLATVFFRLTNVGNNCLIKNIEIDVTNSTAIQFLDEVNIFKKNSTLINVTNYLLSYI